MILGSVTLGLGVRVRVAPSPNHNPKSYKTREPRRPMLLSPWRRALRRRDCARGVCLE